MRRKTFTVARMRRNGRLVRVKPDGTEEALDTPSLARRSDAEIEAAASRDCKNPPLTDARVGQLRRVPRVKTLRRALALTQEEFATRYHIPLGTLRDWEQGRSEPDQRARAYLTVIARDPEGVERALHPELGNGCAHVRLFSPRGSNPFSLRASLTTSRTRSADFDSPSRLRFSYLQVFSWISRRNGKGAKFLGIP